MLKNYFSQSKSDIFSSGEGWEETNIGEIGKFRCVKEFKASNTRNWRNFTRLEPLERA